MLNLIPKFLNSYGGDKNLSTNSYGKEGIFLEIYSLKVDNNERRIHTYNIFMRI